MVWSEVGVLGQHKVGWNVGGPSVAVARHQGCRRPLRSIPGEVDGGLFDEGAEGDRAPRVRTNVLDSMSQFLSIYQAC